MTDIQIRNVSHLYESKPNAEYNYIHTYVKKNESIRLTKQKHVYVPKKKIPNQEFKDLLRADWATGNFDNKKLTIMYNITYQMLYKIIPEAKPIKKIYTDETIELIKTDYKTGRFSINELIRKYDISYAKIKPIIDTIEIIYV